METEKDVLRTRLSALEVEVERLGATVGKFAFSIPAGMLMVEVIGIRPGDGCSWGPNTYIKRVDTQESFEIMGLRGEVGTTFAHKFTDGKPDNEA